MKNSCGSHADMKAVVENRPKAIMSIHTKSQGTYLFGFAASGHNNLQHHCAAGSSWSKLAASS